MNLQTFDLLRGNNFNTAETQNYPSQNYSLSRTPETEHYPSLQTPKATPLRRLASFLILFCIAFAAATTNAQAQDECVITLTGTSYPQRSANANSTGSEITVGGNVTVTGATSTDYGAYANTGGKITIDGSINFTSPANYINVGGLNKNPADITIPTTKTGYDTYTDGTSTVWVKMPASPAAITITHNAAINITGITITLDLDGKYTLEVNSTTGAALTVTNGGAVKLKNELAGTAEFNVNGVTNGVYADGAGNAAITADGYIRGGTYGIAASGQGASVATAANATGVQASTNAEVTIEGSITVPVGATYINAGGTLKTSTDVTSPSTLAGYLEYSDGGSYVWVKNNVPPPTIVSAATNTTGNEITLTFSKAMSSTGLDAGLPDGFTVSVGGAAGTIAATSATASTITLTLSTPIANGQTVAVSYAPGTVMSADGAPLAAFTGTPVTNNVPPATTPTTPPSSASYTVSIGTFADGSVTTNSASATAGATVTLTVSPSAGYELDVITVFRTSSPSTTVSLSGTGLSRTFTMPAWNVTVDATFKKSAAQTLWEQALAIIEAAVYEVPQSAAATEADLAAWLADYINGLLASAGIPLTITAADIYLMSGSFVPSASPTANGSFEFFVMPAGVTGSSLISGAILARTVGNVKTDHYPSLQTLRVYNAMGVLIYGGISNAPETTMPLPARGIYIVTDDKRTIKVVN